MGERLLLSTGFGLSRRQAMQAVGALSFAGAIPSCWPFVKRLGPICPDAIDPDAAGKRLGIDVHAHVFNASDLQVRKFVELVATRQKDGGLANLAKYLGTVLQAAYWGTAPNGKKERDRLLELSRELKDCPRETFDAEVRGLRARQYESAVQSLRNAARQTAPQVGPRALDRAVPWESLATPEQQGLRVIQELPESFESYERQRAAMAAPGIEAARISAQSVVDFAIAQFQYRYVSALDYLRTYRSPTRSVDLVLASLVDYDWWLNGGQKTATSLQDQVDVVAAIAVATAGRVHAFVPFCPYREVAHRLDPSSTFSSLGFVQDAVARRGALGVKLYPPMGFAALGNAEQQSVWSGKDWLGPIAKRTDFGAQLDAAMRDFLRWSTRDTVPVMAHTGLSNGAADELEALAGYRHWRTALQEFPKLTVNFGHFGGVRSREASENTKGFLRLLSGNADAPGSRAFIDAAYFADLLDAPDQLAAQLRALFDLDSQGAKVLPERFMFGSDWKMLLLEAHADRYLTSLERMLDTLAAALGGRYAKLTDDVFANNAADFLMLRKGEPGRRRVEEFYQDQGMTIEPLWMQKLGAPA